MLLQAATPSPIHLSPIDYERWHQAAAVVRLRLIHVLRASRAQLLLALLSAIRLRYGCCAFGHAGAASD